MKFEITRTSQWNSDETPPCEGAIQEVEEITNTYKMEKDLSYYEGYFFNVRTFTENGVKMIELTDKKLRWYLEINSLEELMDFQKKEGSSVILSDNTIEIYDDYRE